MDLQPRVFNYFRCCINDTIREKETETIELIASKRL